MRASVTTIYQRPAVQCEEDAIRVYAPMIRRLASRLAGGGIEMDDLLQVGNMALIKAFRSFDEERGDFPPYAHATISGELKKYLRDYCWSVRPPRRVQELHSRVRSASDDVTQRHGHAPTPTELAAEVGSDIADVNEALVARSCMFPSSLDQPSAQGTRPLSDRLADYEEPFEQVDNAVAVRQLCDGLDPEDRELIHLRYYEGLSQREIAAQLGVSQMKVCRRLTRLLGELRERAVAVAA